jgi:hypothetical protein
VQVLVSIAALTMQIVLALMGVFLSIRPPQGKEAQIWLIAFVVAGAASGFACIKNRQNTDHVQEELKNRLYGLKDSIDHLTKPMGGEAQTPPARGPDKLYDKVDWIGRVRALGFTPNRIAIAALTLQLILALMGIFVSVGPPQGNEGWIWPMAFVVVGAIASFFAIKNQQNNDKALKELKTTIDGLKGSIYQLTKPIDAEAQKPRARNRDTIYENGSAVGRVKGARITSSESEVYFDEIDNTSDLECFKTFEYRDYVLRFVRAEKYLVRLIASPKVTNNVYQHVVCEIVDRAR